jgi:hypothetical protein
MRLTRDGEFVKRLVIGTTLRKMNVVMGNRFERPVSG